jgi:hypothetical protein
VTPSRRTAACQFIATLHLTAETQIAEGSTWTLSATVSVVECYSGFLSWRCSGREVVCLECNSYSV